MGLEIYENGVQTFDSNRLFWLLIGSVAIGAGNQSGSISDPGIGEGTPRAFLRGGPDLVDPIVSFSGTTMSWTKNPSYSFDWGGTIYYAVFV